MAENTAKKLQLTYYRSAIGYSQKHKDTIRALGFHHLNETVVKATFNALDQLKNASDEAILRGKNADELTPFWDRR